MPVKRRVSKRYDAQAYDVWGSIFGSGDDFFDQLQDIGLESQPPGRPFDADALAAWERYGSRWLEENPREKPSWAENEFGRPWENSDAS